MSVSISEIIAGASVHAVPLAGECAGYLVLAAADQAVSAPRRIGPKEVHLEGDGTVRVDGAHAAAEADSEADLRALLDALLVSASSSTPALLRASRRAPGRGIAALVHEIETALIPVNRAAAHRALARLERETERARHAGRLAEQPPAKLVRKEPEPPAVVERPIVESRPSGAAPLPLPAADDEIPSLFAPPVEAIAAYAAEIETRPEPIVARRSAPPPPHPVRTPSPPPLPVRSSPPPLPVIEAQPTTPFFGTLVRSDSEDELDIEVVLDDELIDDELTGVLVRSAPLEESALLDTSGTPEPTEPCLLVLEPESDAVASEAPIPESSDTESSSLLALAVEPSLSAADEARLDALVELLALESTLFAVAPVDGSEPEAVLEEPSLEAAPSREARIDAEPPAPSPVELLLEAPLVEPYAIEYAFEAPSERPPPIELFLETPPFDAPFEMRGETVPLAFVVAPAVSELPPEPRLPMPKPRPSDVEDLLERMARAGDEGNDELRSSLKGLAGLEATPPPPLPES
jgi:hypothetical protein